MRIAETRPGADHLGWVATVVGPLDAHCQRDRHLSGVRPSQKSAASAHGVGNEGLVLGWLLISAPDTYVMLTPPVTGLRDAAIATKLRNVGELGERRLC